MESQNHYYGHSSALATYAGLDRARHLPGLVQHGWTAVSPLDTHFRDFPAIGTATGPARRSLFVWSHSSRAWDPATADRRSVPIGAPWHYLCARLGPAPTGSGTVILPVHGIATQALRGDHRAVARAWAATEGPATVCLYHVEADDPRVVEAYRSAGHEVVTLGRRTDPAFLGRLHALLTGAGRVVSNRLSTPIVYAASLGIPTAVTGDAMHLAGEDSAGVDRLRERWPEFYDDQAGAAQRRAAAEAETGLAYVREPEELRALLRWDRRHVGPWLDHWLTAPVSRTLTAVRRRSSSATPTAASEGASLGAVAWLRASAAYLPRPLGRAPSDRSEPIRVAATA
ncbi:hypothetical protein [Cellulomonas triticagri]|uniref:Glycosyltransferase n=1 Tax=Cellulomonas triticagri TaxID=2483352 RepID=A0A3M2JM16_9CELL|nr:hypothetical protein [Cellulomonas triticagri]RMI13281.1 hypothetical protein EBM89_05120 [Cellulomonas triticagri]